MNSPQKQFCDTYAFGKARQDISFKSDAIPITNCFFALYSYRNKATLVYYKHSSFLGY